jgi:hypothetical protein
MTNTDLQRPGPDPRLQLLKRLQTMNQVKGWSQGGKRLQAEPDKSASLEDWVTWVLQTSWRPDTELTFEMINGDSKWGPITRRDRSQIEGALTEFPR